MSVCVVQFLKQKVVYKMHCILGDCANLRRDCKLHKENTYVSIAFPEGILHNSFEIHLNKHMFLSNILKQ